MGGNAIALRHEICRSQLDRSLRSLSRPRNLGKRVSGAVATDKQDRQKPTWDPKHDQQSASQLSRPAERANASHLFDERHLAARRHRSPAYCKPEDLSLSAKTRLAYFLRMVLPMVHTRMMGIPSAGKRQQQCNRVLHQLLDPLPALLRLRRRSSELMQASNTTAKLMAPTTTAVAAAATAAAAAAATATAPDAAAATATVVVVVVVLLLLLPLRLRRRRLRLRLLLLLRPLPLPLRQ